MADMDNHQRGVLHMAVEWDFPTVLSVLLEKGADPDLMDEEGNISRLPSEETCHLLHSSLGHTTPPTVLTDRPLETAIVCV